MEANNVKIKIEDDASNVKIKVENDDNNIKVEDDSNVKIKVEDDSNVKIKVEDDNNVKVEDDCNSPVLPDTESEEFSENDNSSDSDFMPEPVKKKAKTAVKRTRATKSKTASVKNVKSEVKNEDDEDIPSTGKKRKAPVKRTNVAAKKIKIEKDCLDKTVSLILLLFLFYNTLMLHDIQDN